MTGIAPVIETIASAQRKTAALSDGRLSQQILLVGRKSA